MLIIDSVRETKMGVGLSSWPPTLLNKGEAMIPQSVAKYLDINIGDEVLIYVDWGKTKEMNQVKSPKAHLLAMLATDIHNVAIVVLVHIPK